jgi:hypothetical protein
MTRPKALLLLTAVFFLGVLTGVFGSSALQAQRVQRIAAPDAERMERRALGFFVRRLDLDDAQRTEIRKILRRTRAQLDEVRDETAPRIQAIFEESYREMLPHLRPDQQEELQRMREAGEHRFRHPRRRQQRSAP